MSEHNRRFENNSLRRKKRSISTLGLLVLLSNTSPCSSLTATKVGPTKTRILSRKHYRIDPNTPETDAVIAVATSLLKVASPLVGSTLVTRMPAWLNLEHSHLAEKNIALLKDAMITSYVSDSQAQTVLQAIKKAAGGDRNKIAGAAEFCLILVETMEMEVNALIAGVFHYCACLTARERSATGELSDVSFWEQQQDNHDGVGSFGMHAVEIAKDAARLKRIERVAASVIQNHGESSRAMPDSHDSENLKSLLLSETKQWRALAIRSAACLYRLRGILTYRSEHSTYGQKTKLTPEEVRASREAINIFAPLASRLGMHRLKNELEGTAFKILYRRQYEHVMALSRETRRSSRLPGPVGINSVSGDTALGMTIGEGMKSVLSSVKQELSELLRNDKTFAAYADNVILSARVKEPFSLWKKMLRTGAKRILDVPDSLALRARVEGNKMSSNEDKEVIRARERALCYYLQKVCTDRWTPLPGNRFKDYIERPKANGYQSLHYTAFTERDGVEWPFEIQVRSGEMHQVAEYGLAAHWDYKAKPKTANTSKSQRDLHELDQSSSAYLKFVQEWHWQQQSQSVVSPRSPKSFMGANGDYVASLSEDPNKVQKVRAHAERIAPYIAALNRYQSDLAREVVFVFVSSASAGNSIDGKVLALRSGACVLDALREGEKQFGMELNWSGANNLVQVNNDEPISMTQRLSNGDVLTFPSKGLAP